MQYRQLGRTGLEDLDPRLRRVGDRRDDVDRRGRRRAARYAPYAAPIELWVNFIDTANGYGNGHSEILVGQVVRDSPETVYVATKIPPKNRRWPAPAGVRAEDAFPADWVVALHRGEPRAPGRRDDRRAAVPRLVGRVGWPGRLARWRRAVEARRQDSLLRRLDQRPPARERGQARRVGRGRHRAGATTTSSTRARRMKSFPAVEAANVGVIVRVPFDEGALTGRIRPDTEFPDGDFRHNYFKGDRKQQVWDRVQAIAADLGVSVDEAAPTSPCAWASRTRPYRRPFPGCARKATSSGTSPQRMPGLLTDEQIALLRRHRWVRSFYGSTISPFRSQPAAPCGRGRGGGAGASEARRRARNCAV